MKCEHCRVEFDEDKVFSHGAKSLCGPCIDAALDTEGGSRAVAPQIKFFFEETNDPSEIETYEKLINDFCKSLDATRIEIGPSNWVTITVTEPMGGSSGGVAIADERGMIAMKQRLIQKIFTRVMWWEKK